jgi:hypothetical protein
VIALTKVVGVLGSHDWIAVEVGAKERVRLDSAERDLLVLWLERDPAARGLAIAFLGVWSTGLVVLDPTNQLALVGTIDRWEEALAAAQPVPPPPEGVRVLRQALMGSFSHAEHAA